MHNLGIAFRELNSPNILRLEYLLLYNNVRSGSFACLSVFVQLWLLFTLLFIVNIHHMFRSNWPSWSVQILQCGSYKAPKLQVDGKSIKKMPDLHNATGFCNIILQPCQNPTLRHYTKVNNVCALQRRYGFNSGSINLHSSTSTFPWEPTFHESNINLLQPLIWVAGWSSRQDIVLSVRIPGQTESN
jgi:hypothetical protein